MSDRRARLEAAREKLEEAMDLEEGKDLAPLVREYRALLAELDGLTGANVQTPTDEIAQRREERRRKAVGG